MSTTTPRGSVGRWLAIMASVVVTATIVASIMVTGTPSERRAAKLDERRVQDLRRLSSAISSYAELYDALPANLGVLAKQPGSRLVFADPVTGEPYGYEATGPKAFRVCAVFTKDGAATATYADSDWDHGMGRQCFDHKVPKSD